MNTHELLIKAREKISKPENWCKGVVAKDSFGRPAVPYNSNASSWCAVGAILVLRGCESGISAAIQVLSNCLGDDCIGRFNDTHTHEEVLALFDKAIKSLEV